MLWGQPSSCKLWSSDANFVYFLAVLPFLLCSVINVKEVADKSGQADFAETMEMENGNGNTETGNTESTAHACSQVPLCIDLTCDAAIGHVFFEVYLSCFCSCSVWYVAVPRSRRWFGRLFSCSFYMFVLLTHVFFLCIIVARSVSLATHWQCYVCTADSMIAMTELAYIVLYSGM